jgi:DNA primase small subunit
MTDYDSIRTCCKGKILCNFCWSYIRAAYDVLKFLLEEAFGFKHILWVYSGRRGMHAWVCDKEAKLLDKKMR